MKPFAAPAWLEPDFWAITAGRGLASIHVSEQTIALDWLAERGYTVDTIDCTGGLADVVEQINRLFRWEEQFGYKLSLERRNLDALNDGFDFAIPEGAGHVMQLVRPDVIWQEDAPWTIGLLEMAGDYGLLEFGLGRRFFTLLVTEWESPLLGVALRPCRVPHFFNGW